MTYCKNVANVDYGSSEFFFSPYDYKLNFGEFWANKNEGLVEKVIVPGIGNDMQIRNTLNIDYFTKLGDFLKENPVLFKPEFSGLGLI